MYNTCTNGHHQKATQAVPHGENDAPVPCVRMLGWLEAVRGQFYGKITTSRLFVGKKGNFVLKMRFQIAKSGFKKKL